MSLRNKGSCNVTAIHLWDVIPECPSGSPLQRAESCDGLRFSFDMKGEHECGWQGWMSVERIKVGDQTPSEGIGEWVSEWVGEGGVSLPLPRPPTSLFGWKLPRNPGLHLFKAKDDLLALTRKEVTSDRLTQQIALQLQTCLGPAAACFSAASIPPDLGSCYKIWHWRSAGFLFRAPQISFPGVAAYYFGFVFPATHI